MSSLFPLLPAFLDLTGRAAVLLSGEAGLAPLARRLLDCGAGVSVFDRAPSASVAALGPPARLIPRRWRSSDLAGVALIVAGVDEPRLARARAAARAARALFYAPHDVAASDVRLGAAVAGGAIAIGVTSPNLPPEVSLAVARRFEESSLAGYDLFLEAAARAAARVEAMVPDNDRRSVFWRETADAALKAGSAAPSDWDSWIVRRMDAK